MALITIRVLDGADRGKVFENLSTPVTIGREEGNTIQLNDERVSRFHLKIQEDQGRLVLTDLQSTNGTKVNGEDMQLRILRFGDMITLGRSVLLFGSREQIAGRMASLRKREDGNRPNADGTDSRKTIAGMEPGRLTVEPVSFDMEINAEDPDFQAALQSYDPPDLPDRLSPGQAAQLADMLNYFHIRIRRLVETVRLEKDQDDIRLAQRQWQNLIDVQMRLANYLRLIGEPGSNAPKS